MNLRDLQKEYGEWATKVFPKATQQSSINHLKDEVENEIHPDCDPKELADAVLLLLHLAYRMNVDLEKAVLEKFEINKNRKWQVELNEKGFQSHLEE